MLTIFCYGCEIWSGHGCLDSTEQQWTGGRVKGAHGPLAWQLGMSWHAPTVAVLAESVASPLAVHWARLTLASTIYTRHEGLQACGRGPLCNDTFLVLSVTTSTCAYACMG